MARTPTTQATTSVIVLALALIVAHIYVANLQVEVEVSRSMLQLLANLQVWSHFSFVSVQFGSVSIAAQQVRAVVLLLSSCVSDQIGELITISR